MFKVDLIEISCCFSDYEIKFKGSRWIRLVLITSFQEKLRKYLKNACKKIQLADVLAEAEGKTQRHSGKWLSKGLMLANLLAEEDAAIKMFSGK